MSHWTESRGKVYSVGTAALHSLRHDRGSHVNNSAGECKHSPSPPLLASQLARARQGEGGKVNRLKDVITALDTSCRARRVSGDPVLAFPPR